MASDFTPRASNFPFPPQIPPIPPIFLPHSQLQFLCSHLKPRRLLAPPTSAFSTNPCLPFLSLCPVFLRQLPLRDTTSGLSRRSTPLNSLVLRRSPRTRSSRLYFPPLPFLSPPLPVPLCPPSRWCRLSPPRPLYPRGPPRHAADREGAAGPRVQPPGTGGEGRSGNVGRPRLVGGGAPVLGWGGKRRKMEGRNHRDGCGGGHVTIASLRDWRRGGRRLESRGVCSAL